MRVTNPRIPLTILGLAASCGLLLAIHTGQARTGTTATVSTRPSTDAPSPVAAATTTRPVASSQSQQKKHHPQRNNPRAAPLTDANAGTVVGKNGTIVRTTDAENSWTIQASGTTQTLWAVSFTDANHGTAGGEGGT